MSKKNESMEKKEDNVIFIGGKDFIRYLSAANFSLENNPLVIIKSRGKFTSRAIDVAEVLKQQEKITVENINIDSETFTKEEEGKEPREIRVSTIEIVIKRVK